MSDQLQQLQASIEALRDIDVVSLSGPELEARLHTLVSVAPLLAAATAEAPNQTCSYFDRALKEIRPPESNDFCAYSWRGPERRTAHGRCLRCSARSWGYSRGRARVAVARFGVEYAESRCS